LPRITNVNQLSISITRISLSMSLQDSFFS
jgi:hypothetical protein